MSEKGEECCGACAGNSNRVVLFDWKLRKIGDVQVPASAISGICGLSQQDEDLLAVGTYIGPSYDIYVISKRQKQILRTLKGHDNSICDLLVLECCKRDGGVLASCGWDTMKAVLLWSLSTGEVLMEFSHPGRCYSLCELPWKQWLCCPIYDNYVQFVDVETLKEVHRFNRVDYLDFYQDQVSVCQEKNLICCGNYSRTQLCSFYDLTSGQRIAKIPKNSRTSSYSNAFSEIGHSFVVEDWTGLMCIFDIRNLTTCVRDFKPADVISGLFGLRCVGGSEFLSSHDKGVAHFNVEGEIISNNASIGFYCYGVTGFATDSGALYVPPEEVLLAKIRRVSDALSGDWQEFFLDALLKFGKETAPIAVPRCLLELSHRVSVGSSGSSDSSGVLSLDIEHGDQLSRVDQLPLAKILTGQPFNIDTRSLLSYYNLFMSLGMHRHGYMICLDLVKEIKSPRMAVGLALECWEYYHEKDLYPDGHGGDVDLLSSIWDEEEGAAVSGAPEPSETRIVRQMTSGISHAAMMLLVSVLDQVNAVPKLKAAVHMSGVSVFLDVFKPDPLYKHPDFGGFDKLEEVPTSFSQLAKETLSCLWASDRQTRSDVSVIAIDDTEDQEPRTAHAFVLYWKSEFFSQVIRFGGGVSKDYDCKKRVIYVRNLSSGALDALLEFVYTGEISCSDLSDLLSLLLHCQVYRFDTEVRECVISRFKAVTVEYVKSGRFEGFILEVGHLLDRSRAELEEMLKWIARNGHMRNWPTRNRHIWKERLEHLIEQSVSKRKRARKRATREEESDESDECRRKRRKLNPLSDK